MLRNIWKETLDYKSRRFLINYFNNTKNNSLVRTLENFENFREK